MIVDLLPTLNEGDERVSLGDILLHRDGCLSERELWAVCKECCLALQVRVHTSHCVCVTSHQYDSACCTKCQYDYFHFCMCIAES